MVPHHRAQVNGALMSDWKPYAVEAALGTMKLLVQSCSRGYRWRLSSHPTPGTKGDAKRKHGRESIVDQVTALLTVPEVDQLVQLANREAPLTWTHPLLPSITGHVENLDVPAESQLYGYFLASFQVVEAYDPQVTQSAQPGTLSPASSQAKADNLYKDFLDDIDGLDDIPTDANGTAFNDALGDLGDAFDDIDSAFDDIVDPIGDGTWRDLSRALDAFSDAADTFIDAAREIESSIGAVSHRIQTAPLLIRESVGDAVDALKAPAGTVASFITQQPSDLFSMMLEAGVEVTEGSIVELMEDNGITDPLFIPAGLTIAIPVAS